MKQMITVKGNIKTIWFKRSADDIRKGWADAHGQGNHKARMMELNDFNVVVPVIEEQAAILLTAEFLALFAIDSCAYWDGTRLSLYCGDVGGDARYLKAKVLEMIMDHLVRGKPFEDDLLDEGDGNG